MITTDIKTAIRNIARNKIQSSISILGLGIGLGSLIVILALIIHDTSFDRFVPGYENVYRVVWGKYCGTGYPLADAMKKDFPEVKDFFRINQANNVQVRNLKGDSGNNQEFAFADPSIYEIYGIKFIEGGPANSLSEVAISEKTAAKFFGSSSPVGQILRAKLNNDFIPLSVSGVYRDFPANSTLYPDYICPVKLVGALMGQFTSTLGAYGSGISNFLTWDLSFFYTYVVLEKNADVKSLISKMQGYSQLVSYESGKKNKYDLQPLKEIYLKSESYISDYIFFRTGNPNNLKYFWAISVLILVISMTNYIFLTRGTISSRLQEMGTRKVMGASEYRILRQIILESNLITVLSLIPASFVIDSGMSFINSTMNKTLTLDVFSNPVMWVLLIAVVVITGTLSGLAIAYKISKVPVLLLLSGKDSEVTGSGKWNYSFLILHFSLYIILVVSVLTVARQLNYSRSHIRGLNPGNIIISGLKSPGLKAGFASICSEIERVPGVIKTAGSSLIPFMSNSMPLNLRNYDGEQETLDGLIIGEGITEILAMDIVDGTSFGKYQRTSGDILINESTAKKFNLKAGDTFLKLFHIRGIVKDFNCHSLYTPIHPMVMLQQNPEMMELLVIKTDGSNDKAIISRLRETYLQKAPDEIFEINYLTDLIKDIYVTEKNQGQIMGAFSLLALILAIMGLFGIALISISKKTKEIGMRKVNGATAMQIILLLNKVFVRWVIVSVFTGIPISIYVMTLWLKKFAYKTDLNWWIFATAGISALFIAVLTVSLQSWKTANKNPINSLRYE